MISRMMGYKSVNYCIIVILFLGYFPRIVSCTSKNVSVSPPALSTANFTSQLVSPEDALIIGRLPDVVYYLSTVSPDHASYLIYDDTFKDVGIILKGYVGTGKGITVIKLISDFDLLINSITTPLLDISTGRRHFLVICSSSNIIKLFVTISESNLEDPTVWWILIVTDKNVTRILQGILREGSQVIVVHMMDPDYLFLSSSYVQRRGGIGFKDNTATLSTEAPLNFPWSDAFEDLEESYSNFDGRQLFVAANDNNPFIALKKDTGELYAVAGFEYVILDSLSKALNFTYRMVTPEDGKWGGPLPNGNVIGLIGEVAYRRAHFAICEITVTRPREEVIDFSYPYYIESVTMISRTPREITRAFAAFSPFSPLVWLCIASSVLIMGFVLMFESWIIKKYLPGERVVDSFEIIIFNVFGSLMKQENLIPFRYWPHKLTFIFWYLFCLIVSVLYSGMLTATLIIPSFEKPINALTDLPRAIKEGFSLVINADTNVEYMFKNAKEGIYADTWALFDHTDRSKSFVPHPSYAMEGVLEEKQVLINAILGVRYLATRKGIHRYHFGRDSFAPQYYGVACISGAPFMETFNKMISYMVEGGLITKWVDDEFQKVAGNNIEVQKSGPRAFTIHQLQAAFYVLPIGYGIGALFHGIERISVYL